jgi:hypothetical protein
VIRREHPVVAVPVLARRWYEVSQTIEELKRREFDDATPAGPGGLPPAPRADLLGGFVLIRTLVSTAHPLFSRASMSAAAIVLEANHRCNQENLFAHLKSDMHALSAPVDSLVSNWAYMVMASLAWSLKAWMALCLPHDGSDAEARSDEKQSLLRMEFTTFRRAFMMIPAQIVKTGRRIIFTLLA